ncbi:hypothetical protein Avbf_10547, partial [Armadillidium vulgare]
MLQIHASHIPFLFKKHSPLTYPISNKLNRLIETGIYLRIHEYYVKEMKRAGTINIQNEYRQELKLRHLQTAFYGLLI